MAGEVVQRVAQGHGLPRGPGADAVRLVRVPVRRHRLRVVVELEGEERVARRDQLVVDLALRAADVAAAADVRAHADIALVDHPARHRLRVRPSLLHVLGAPAAGRAVAGLALHAVLGIDAAGDEILRHVRGVAIEADLLLIRRRFQAHVFGDALGEVVEEDVVRLRVAVAVQPRVVLVLAHALRVQRDRGAVAAGAHARGDADVTAGRVRLLRARGRGGEDHGESETSHGFTSYSFPSRR